MSTPIGRTGLTRITPQLGEAPVVMSSPSVIGFFDDFLGNLIDTKWKFTEGTDGATADLGFATGDVGGVLRLTTGDTGTGTAADQCGLASALQWKASNGGLTASARVKLSQITDAYLFFGFSDSMAFETPVESAGVLNTLTTTASDAVGFMFDTRMTSDKFWLVGVKGNVDAVAQDSGVAPVADTFVNLRVNLSNAGVASFYIDDTGVGSAMVDAVTAATALTPCLLVSKTATATSMYAELDYVAVSSNR